VILVIDGEFIACCRNQWGCLALLEFEDRPHSGRFRDQLSLLDTYLQLDSVDPMAGSDDIELLRTVLTFVDDFHLDRRPGRASQPGQNISGREAFQRLAV